MAEMMYHYIHGVDKNAEEFECGCSLAALKN